MPRKTKEQNDLELKNDEKVSTRKASTKTSVNRKSTSSSKKSASSKTKTSTSKSTKKDSTPTSASAKKKSTTASTSTKKKSTTTKKKTTATSSTTRKKSTASKKTTTTKKKASTKKGASKEEKVEVVEYYDLPYRYNQTVVKVLAQTPTNLFIYWDISDKDRKNFEKKYGEHFFENTKPVLIVHNDTIGYSFEVDINDFANSWYLNVADSKCDYRIELGRRPIVKTQEIQDDYIYVSTSNEIESPNDHILFNKEQKMIYFKNVKTGEQVSKPISSISFIRNMGKIYNISDFYKALYQNENIEELYDLSNPSSGNPSSRKELL